MAECEISGTRILLISDAPGNFLSITRVIVCKFKLTFMACHRSTIHLHQAGQPGVGRHLQ